MEEIKGNGLEAFNSKIETPIILKETLNKNRVLTMSNNRKCNYLIVNVGRESATMMGINTQGRTSGKKDIIILKTFEKKSVPELVDEADWLCREFDIQIILTDRRGCGIGFYDEFLMNVPTECVNIRLIDGMKINNFDINDIIKDLKYGNLRFLQDTELARTYYRESFLGFSNIMSFHYETDKLINEICNIKLDMTPNHCLKFSVIDNEIGKSRANCLLMYYSYPMSAVSAEDSYAEKDKKFDIAKRMSIYNVVSGTFYKYMFKCIDNEKIKVLFYYNDKNKILQFQNIAQEKEFKDLFSHYIKNTVISKDEFRIELFNGSEIKFLPARDSSRGYRGHYAIVDKEIDIEMFHNVIQPKLILFDIDKREGKLKDNYNMEFIDM